MASKRLTEKVECAECGRMVTGYMHPEGPRPYRHKTDDSEWCHGHEITTTNSGAGVEEDGSQPPQGDAPAPSAVEQARAEHQKARGPDPSALYENQVIQEHAEAQEEKPALAEIWKRPEVSPFPEYPMLPTLRDVFPPDLQEVVPSTLGLEYLPLCWLIWNAGIEAGKRLQEEEMPPRRMVDLREPPKTPPEEKHADLYDTTAGDERADPLLKWTPPPGGVVDVEEALEGAQDDDDEDGDEQPRTRVLPREDGQKPPSGRLGESGFSLETETALLEWAAEKSTQPRRAEKLALEALTEMRQGGDTPPGSAGKIILTKLLNAKILKGASADGFLEKKLGKVEDLTDGQAMASATKMDMDERARELGVVGGEE